MNLLSLITNSFSNILENCNSREIETSADVINLSFKPECLLNDVKIKMVLTLMETVNTDDSTEDAEYLAEQI